MYQAVVRPMLGMDIPQLPGALGREIQQVNIAQVFGQLPFSLHKGFVVFDGRDEPGCVFWMLRAVG
ncbi:hypothetical protein NG2371_06935 [Nocardia gamkensis]|nr:hypothetical protein [Nocardia gamkensis]